MALSAPPSCASLKVDLQVKKRAMAETSKLSQAIEWPAKFLANGAHAQQDIPSQHRLLNAMVMFGGWWGMDQIRQIVFGVKMQREGEYVEIKREDVPGPLQFLHKAIEWNPHSDSPDNQWKKLAYQMMPGVGAGVGAILGSTYAYNRSGRAQGNKERELKGLEKLNMLDMDYVAQYGQSKSLRGLSAFFGTFSAASGLTYLYGLALTTAFASANGGKIFAGSLARGKFAPHRAVDEELSMVSSYVKEAMHSNGKISETWAKDFETRVLQPLFGHELNTPELQAQAVKSLHGVVEESYKRFTTNGKANGTPAEDIVKAITEDLKAKLGAGGLEKTVKDLLHLDPKNAKPGNANAAIWSFENYMSKLGLGKTFGMGGKPLPEKALQSGSMGLGLGAAAAGAAVLGGATLLGGSSAKAATITADGTATGAAEGQEPSKHKQPELAGKTAEQYAYESVELHEKQYTKDGKQPPALAKWMGNAELAVLPWNRLYCAAGLTAGLMIAGNMAAIATGYTLSKKPVELKNVPTYLHNVTGIVKNYNPHDLQNPRNRWINYAQYAIYSLGGLIGVKLGTDMAYANVHKKNANPNYLEDYLPRVSMHQGENWGMLSAFGGMFASSAGLFMLPIPGLNYGISLAGRTTSMQDRNFMLGGGIGKALSGSATTSFLRLREGSNYLCNYAVGNPAETPTQIEYLAYTMLGPIFKDQLTADHIKQYTEAVHQVRDKYWQEGGIPKEKRAEALKTMKEVFTGAGQEVLFINMGLNPASIDFTSLNGITGTVGSVGISDKIKGEQNAYHQALLKRLPTYVEQGMITQERADWVKAGIEVAKAGGKQPAFVAPQVETPAPEMKPRESDKFTNKVMPKSSYDPLIKKAEAEGDWREAAKLSKAHPVPAAIGG